MGVSHCRVSNPKQSKQSMFIKVAWSGYQNLNMLQKTFTWVGDNSEFCDIRVRAMQGGFTHKGMHTHMYNSQILSNDGNWEIMSTCPCRIRVPGDYFKGQKSGEALWAHNTWFSPVLKIDIILLNA